MCNVVSDLNRVASQRDGKNTMHFLLMALVLSPITFGIYGLVWYHNFSKRIGEELAARNIAYSFGAGTYWGWNFLGSLIFIGPFVYLYKLFKAMNMINASFNQEIA